MKHIVVFGESSCKIFSHIKIQGINFDINLFPDGTILELQKYKIVDYLQENKNTDYLILNFGQFDIEQGYYKSEIEYTKKAYIYNLISHYTIFLKELQKYIDKSKIIIWGINPPILLDNESNIENIRNRTKFSFDFNYECRKMCEDKNLKYTEVFTELLTKENIINTYFINSDQCLKGIDINFHPIKIKYINYILKLIYKQNHLNLNESQIDVINRYIDSHYEVTGCLKPYLNKINETVYKNRYNVDNLYNLNISEEQKKNLLMSFSLREGDIVLELGAYRGLGSIKLSELVGTNGKVIAVEGMKQNFTVLCNNIKKNNISNIIPINCFSSNENKLTTLFSRGNQVNTINSNLQRNWLNHSVVNSYKMDDVLKSLKTINKVTYITLEINLEEYNALLGLEQTLKSNNYIRIVAAAWYSEDLRKKMIDYLESLNFNVYNGRCNRLYAIKNI